MASRLLAELLKRAPGSTGSTTSTTSRHLQNHQTRCFAVSKRGDFATTSLTGEKRLNPGKRKAAFQMDCARIWGNTYDYSRTNYKDNHSAVSIRCPRPGHGSFSMTPRDHIQKRRGCPKCAHRLAEQGLQPHSGSSTWSGSSTYTGPLASFPDPSTPTSSTPRAQNDSNSYSNGGSSSSSSYSNSSSRGSTPLSDIESLGDGERFGSSGSRQHPRFPQTRGVGARPGAGAPKLGQHLLTSRDFAVKIADAALPEGHPQASVAEIGLGAGALTEALLGRSSCRRLVGFEVDEERIADAIKNPRLQKVGVSARMMPDEAKVWNRRDWRQLFGKTEEERCLILQGDVLTTASIPGECHVAVGNLPYRIASPIILKLLAQRPSIRRIVIMVQAEHARTVLASVGSPKYNRLSVITSLTCNVRKLAFPGIVPPEAFTPPPRVDSAVILLEPAMEQKLLHNGKIVDLWALDALLRPLLDAVRGQARSVPLEKAMAAKAEDLGLIEGWQDVLRNAGRNLGGRLPSAIEPEEYLALTGDLLAAGCTLPSPFRRSDEQLGSLE